MSQPNLAPVPFWPGLFHGPARSPHPRSRFIGAALEGNSDIATVANLLDGELPIPAKALLPLCPGQIHLAGLFIVGRAVRYARVSCGRPFGA